MPDKDCHFCDIVAMKADPTFVCELKNSIVLIDFEQHDYLGSSLIVLKDHFEHMHELPYPLLHSFIDERTQLANAISKAFPDVTRLNYANMGNATHHVHEYVIPRRKNDRNSGKSPFPVEKSQRLTDAQYVTIAAKIRSALIL